MGVAIDVTYRDVRLSCPRCHGELDRKNRRESWHCPTCRGVVVETSTLLRKLYLIAPELLPDGGVKGLPMARRTASERRLPCAACGKPMQPVLFHDVELDRCYADEMIWFDATELDRVLEAVIREHDARRSWLARLLDSLYAN